MRTIYALLVLLFVFPISAIGQEKLEGIDEIGNFAEGLAAVRKGNQWGFINEQGELVIDFRDDVVWNKDAQPGDDEITGIRYPAFQEGMCLVQKIDDEIPMYGFMNKKGEVVVDYQFLNVSAFKNGYATGVLVDKVFRGTNEFKLRIYDFKFHDVLLDSSGKIVEFFDRRYNIQLTKKRYEVPSLRAKYLANDMVAVYLEDKGWEIRKVVL